MNNQWLHADVSRLRSELKQLNVEMLSVEFTRDGGLNVELMGLPASIAISKKLLMQLDKEIRQRE